MLSRAATVSGIRQTDGPSYTHRGFQGQVHTLSDAFSYFALRASRVTFPCPSPPAVLFCHPSLSATLLFGFSFGIFPSPGGSRRGRRFRQCTTDMQSVHPDLFATTFSSALLARLRLEQALHQAGVSFRDVFARSTSECVAAAAESALRKRWGVLCRASGGCGSLPYQRRSQDHPATISTNDTNGDAWPEYSLRSIRKANPYAEQSEVV